MRSPPTRNETLRAPQAQDESFHPASWGGARHFTFSYEFETLAEGALFELYIDNNQLATHDVLARLRVRPTLAWLWRDAAMGVSDAPQVRLVV